MASVNTYLLNRVQVGDPLTDQERKILELIALGRTNEMIGRAMNLSSDTVKCRNRYLFRKLGATDRAQAVHVGHQQGILGGRDSGSPKVERAAAYAHTVLPDTLARMVAHQILHSRSIAYATKLADAVLGMPAAGDAITREDVEGALAAAAEQGVESMADLAESLLNRYEIRERPSVAGDASTEPIDVETRNDD